MKYWNEKIECMPRSELEALQSERLRAVVGRVYDNVPHYRAKMDAIGLKPDHIKSVKDLNRLPFTYKQDLRDTYPFGLFAAPMKDIVRVHASSGTTGKQTVVGYTANDIKTWSDIMARTFACAGADSSSLIQIMYGYGLFTGGLGAHYGAEHLGATVIPASGGNTARQIQMMVDFGTTIIACTPSYALYLIDEMAAQGVTREQLKVKAGVFGAEPWSYNMRTQIEEKLGIKAIDIYGLSEIMGPGVSSECMCQCGLHVCEDHFIPEIIDPGTGENLPEGTRGELVFTTITKEGLPLIRYRTRDLSSLNYARCECGRTTVRMEKVTGRTDDMIIIRGVNVFPSQVESVLLEFGETAPHYMLIVDRVDNLDMLEIQVEMTPALFADEIRKIEETEKKIRDRIQSTLGINARIRMVEPRTIGRSEGKAKHVIDKRKI